MRLSIVCLGFGVLLPTAKEAAGQRVLVHHATPAAVLEVLKADLLPQGFKLGDANRNGALFTLDRGNVVQQSGPVASVHVVTELQVRYRVKSDGLEVTASEEAVGATGTSWVDFRRPIQSVTERANLQRLLDSVRVEVEVRPVTRDSIVTHDSSPR